MQLPYIYDINQLISRKKAIPLKNCHYYWRFIYCVICDFRRNKSSNQPNVNFSQNHKSAQDYESANFFPNHKNITQNTRHEPLYFYQISPDRKEINPDFKSRIPEPSIQRHN